MFFSIMMYNGHM